jgi:hypothetical protein
MSTPLQPVGFDNGFFRDLFLHKLLAQDFFKVIPTCPDSQGHKLTAQGPANMIEMPRSRRIIAQLGAKVVY